jgi:hypothetical protein
VQQQAEADAEEQKPDNEQFYTSQTTGGKQKTR